jgi:hypothetical protein
MPHSSIPYESNDYITGFENITRLNPFESFNNYNICNTLLFVEILIYSIEF